MYNKKPSTLFKLNMKTLTNMALLDTCPKSHFDEHISRSWGLLLGIQNFQNVHPHLQILKVKWICTMK